MSGCKHEYDSYNGGLRCAVCDNRISESEYTEWLEQQLAEIRDAVAIYMYSEGCSCCQDSNHDEHQAALGKLLGFPKYEDDSGYDYHVVAEAALLKQGGE